MKVKEIKIEYTTGKTKVITPTKGFIISDKSVEPMADWSINDAFETMATLLLSTMSAQVDNYGTYKPMFDKVEETLSQVKRQLSPETWSKEFAMKYQQAFLWDEVMHDAQLTEGRKYSDLFDKMNKFTTKAAEKLEN